MSQGARNCPFLTLTGRPVSAAATRRSVWRQRKAGICSASTASATGAHWPLSWTSVMTGRPRVSRISAKIGSAAFEPDSALGGARGAIGLVEGRLEHEADRAPLRDLLKGRRHLERMRAAFELAGPGDQRQRQLRRRTAPRAAPGRPERWRCCAKKNPACVAALSGRRGLQSARPARRADRRSPDPVSPAAPRFPSPQSRSRPWRRSDRRRTIATPRRHGRIEATGAGRI